MKFSAIWTKEHLYINCHWNLVAIWNMFFEKYFLKFLYPFFKLLPKFSHNLKGVPWTWWFFKKNLERKKLKLLKWQLNMWTIKVFKNKSCDLCIINVILDVKKVKRHLSFVTFWSKVSSLWNFDMIYHVNPMNMYLHYSKTCFS